MFAERKIYEIKDIFHDVKERDSLSTRLGNKLESSRRILN